MRPLLFGISFLLFTCCTSEAQEAQDASAPEQEKFVALEKPVEEIHPVQSSDSACIGRYQGPEFVMGDDVAHQLSNAISREVGHTLKRLYAEGKYSMVDFDRIAMRTEGMGSGVVTYTLYIPFVRVSNACEAYTSFDHCGGWDHPPALTERKMNLKPALMRGDRLHISKLMRTPEGLQEYWIQWRNKEVQADCAH